MSESDRPGRNKATLPINYKRVSVGPEARRIAREGVITPDRDPFSRVYDVDDTLMLGALLPRFKEERYGVLAVIIDRVVDRAIANRLKTQPHSFSVGVSEYSVQKELGNQMQDALKTAQDQEIESLENVDSSNPAGSAFRRLAHLERFGGMYYTYNEFDFQELSRGLGTAVLVITTSLSAISKLYPDALITQEEFSKTAKNSYPLVAEIAALHFESFISIADFDESMLALKKTDNGYKLDLTPLARASFYKKPKHSWRNRYRYDKTTHGCPAIVSIDGAAPIKKLWDWALDGTLSHRG
jgi:hypothetical protein